MSSLRRILLAAVAASLGLLEPSAYPAHGISIRVPWSRPAGWEGQIPGMGQPSGR